MGQFREDRVLTRTSCPLMNLFVFSTSVVAMSPNEFVYSFDDFVYLGIIIHFHFYPILFYFFPDLLRLIQRSLIFSLFLIIKELKVYIPEYSCRSIQNSQIIEFF